MWRQKKKSGLGITFGWDQCRGERKKNMWPGVLWNQRLGVNVQALPSHARSHVQIETPIKSFAHKIGVGRNVSKRVVPPRNEFSVRSFGNRQLQPFLYLLLRGHEFWWRAI